MQVVYSFDQIFVKRDTVFDQGSLISCKAQGCRVDGFVILQVADAPVAFIDEVGDESVKVNLNHPLAGKTMVFEVSIAGLRQATAEELDHGHVHGKGHAH